MEDGVIALGKYIEKKKFNEMSERHQWFMKWERRKYQKQENIERENSVCISMHLKAI